MDAGAASHAHPRLRMVGAHDPTSTARTSKGPGWSAASVLAVFVGEPVEGYCRYSARHRPEV